MKLERVERRQAAELIYHIPAWLKTIPDIVVAALKLDPRILDPSLVDTPVMRRDKRNMTHVVSNAVRERVEHCPGILFAVLKFLSAPDLARAGWCHAYGIRQLFPTAYGKRCAANFHCLACSRKPPAAVGCRGSSCMCGGKFDRIPQFSASTS